MAPPFPFEPLLIFGFLSAMLLLGLLLRATVPFLQKFLFPASLIGGLAGLFLINTGLLAIDTETVKAFAYHFFNISFISVGLTPPDPDTASRKREKTIFRGSVWMALVQGATFPMQAVIGTVLVSFFVIGGQPLFETFGFLLPLAFNEGPGQALSFGKVWETAGFADAATIGLTFATLGYFFAFFVGVPMANRGLKKQKYTRKKLPDFFSRGILPGNETPPSAGGLTTHSANMDSLALQFSQVGVVYLVTYLFLLLMTHIMPPDAAGMIWGFFFLFGLVFAVILRGLAARTPFRRLMNPPFQRRITGFSVDYLIVATGCGIELLVLQKYMAPLVVIALTGGILTTLLVFMLGKRLSEYTLERAVAIYGVVTGTVSCGLMLLRIVDPEFKTPAARELGFMNIFAVPVVGGLTCLLNAPFWWGWTVFATTLVFAGILFVSLALLLNRKLWNTL